MAGSAFDKFLGVGQSEVVADFPDRLDDSNLVVTERGKHDVEFVLLFSGRCIAAGRSRHSYRCGSRRADAPLVFEGLHQVRDFENGQAAQFFYEFISICHFVLWVFPS